MTSEGPGASAGSSGGVEPPEADEVVAPKGVSVLLEVADRGDKPLPQAYVGTRASPTDEIEWHAVNEQGTVLIENVDVKERRFVAEVRAAGYAPASVGLQIPVVPPGEEVHVGHPVRLSPHPKRHKFNPQLPATVTQGSVVVNFPAGGLRHGGQPVYEDVEATVVHIDPTLDSPNLFPAPLEGERASDGSRTPLLTLGMVDVTAWGKDARDREVELELDPSTFITLDVALPLELAGTYKVGDTIPQWVLDRERAMWIEDGEGEIIEKNGALVWRAKLRHLSTWNIDHWPNYGSVRTCTQITLVPQDVNTPPNLIPLTIKAEHKVGNNGYVDAKIFWPDKDGKVCVDFSYGTPGDAITIRPFDFNYGQKYEFAIPANNNPPNQQCGSGNPKCPFVHEFVIPNVCVPGSWKPCFDEDGLGLDVDNNYYGFDDYYLEHPGLDGVGTCSAPRKYCNINGSSWGACTDPKLPAFDPQDPKKDLCNDNNGVFLDTNCDGVVDPICESCSQGKDLSCYPGNETDLCYDEDKAMTVVCSSGTVVNPAPPKAACRRGSFLCMNNKIVPGCQGYTLPAESENCDTPESETCTTVATCSQADVHHARTLSGANTATSTTIYAMEVDRTDMNNNSVIVLYQGDDTTLGNCNKGQVDPVEGIYLAKFDLGANNLGAFDCVWRRRLGDYSFVKKESSLGNISSDALDDIAALAVDTNTGGIFVVGTATGPFEPLLFPGESGPGCTEALSPANGKDLFLAKFDKSGMCEWKRIVPGLGDQYAFGVVARPSQVGQPDDLAIAGFAKDAVTLSPGCNVPANHAFVGRLLVPKVAKEIDAPEGHCANLQTFPFSGPVDSLLPAGFTRPDGADGSSFLALNFRGLLKGKNSFDNQFDIYVARLAPETLAVENESWLLAAGLQVADFVTTDGSEVMLGGYFTGKQPGAPYVHTANGIDQQDGFWLVLNAGSFAVTHAGRPESGPGNEEIASGALIPSNGKRTAVLGLLATNSLKLYGDLLEQPAENGASWSIALGRVELSNPTKHYWSGIFGEKTQMNKIQTLRSMRTTSKHDPVFACRFYTELDFKIDNNPPLEGSLNNNYATGCLALARQ